MSLGSVVILYSLYLMSVSGQKLDQEISWTRKKGEVVSFSCKDYDRCGTGVYWYQKKEGETFTLILIIKKDTCGVYGNFDHPQEDDFSAMRKKNTCDLKIQSVKVSHSATYYCACWNPQLLFDKGIFTVYGYVFGSGTRLYVTDNHVRKPKVTVYPASNPESNGKTTLLCLARDMFPDLVKISWKMEDEYGQTVEVSKAETEQLEQREEGRTTSMITIDQENACKNKYRCYVEHEGDTHDVDMLKDPFFVMCSLNLASLVYTVMIVKSMVYCCGLSLLLHHRKMRKWTQHL
nr:immunoglobulin lambda-1 light chain-like [Salvelinus alpinus]